MPPKSAGFEGSLSYRSGYGIPGYTGYCPGSECIPVNTKGSTLRTGKLGDSATKAALTSAMNNANQESHYRAAYTAEKGAYNPDNRHGGGYWLFDRKVAEGGCAALSSTTTYRADMCSGAETAERGYKPTEGLSPLIATAECARRGLAGGAVTAATRNVPVTSKGDVIGYTTTYSSNKRRVCSKMVLQDPLTGGSAAAGAPRSASRPAEFRHKTLPRAMPPRLDGTSTYTRDLGPAGGDPAARVAPTENTMTHHATTVELDAGGPRSTWHIPGYTGFQCATKHNARAVEHSAGKEPRPDVSEGTMLYTLQQYPRGRVPGTTTFKPTEARNITSVQPAHGATTETTYGFANHLRMDQGMPVRDNKHCIDSTRGLMGTFTSAGETLSDNGVTDAQLFCSLVRPYEGLAKGARPSKRTTVGGPFPDSSCVP